MLKVNKQRAAAPGAESEIDCFVITATLLFTRGNGNNTNGRPSAHNSQITNSHCQA